MTVIGGTFDAGSLVAGNSKITFTGEIPVSPTDNRFYVSFKVQKPSKIVLTADAAEQPNWSGELRGTMDIYETELTGNGVDIYSLTDTDTNPNYSTISTLLKPGTYVLAIQPRFTFYESGISPTGTFQWNVYVSDQPVESLTVSPRSNVSSVTLRRDAQGRVSSPASRGSIRFSDTDVTARPVGLITGETVSVKDAKGDSVPLTAGQITAIEAAFTIAPIGGNTNNGAIHWTFDPKSQDLSFLREGEIATVAATVTVTDATNNLSDSATVTETVRGSDSLHLDISENGGGYGVITDTINGLPVGLSQEGYNYTACAYDDCMPVPAGTYTVTYDPDGGTGDVLRFSDSYFHDRKNIEIHIGNSPGDSKGCVVLGNVPIEDGALSTTPGTVSYGFWSGLVKEVQSIANGSNNPITVTVHGDTAQPTLTIKPKVASVAAGQHDRITLAIAGLATDYVVDKDINVYFKVTGAGGVDSAKLISGSGVQYDPATGRYRVTIFGNHATSGHPSTTGSDSVDVILNTAGLAPGTLKFVLVKYDGTRYPWTKPPAPDYTAGKTLLEGSKTAVVKVMAPATKAAEVASLSTLDGQFVATSFHTPAANTSSEVDLASQVARHAVTSLAVSHA